MASKTEMPSQLSSSYDHSAKEYAAGRPPERVTRFVAEELDFFVSQLPKISPPKILDLGSGPGEESEYIRNKFGTVPECVDISPEMLKMCAERGLTTRQEDFSRLSDRDDSVAGVFMNFSFLHIPKTDAVKVLGEIHRALCPGGALQITLFEGQGEGLEKKTKYQHPRFFAYYQQDELRQVVSQRFEVIRESKLKNNPRNLLSVTGKKS